MNCAGCQRENPADAAFCAGCGRKLGRVCSSCQRENDTDASFCNGCGAPVAVETSRPTPTERSPADYTPKHLADKILQSKSALEGERKQVTVLFADVKGSMEISEQLDAEEWHRILERFFQILTEGVHRFEGTVNQYTGDGVMALFGAPIAHEDHAQRACYAALHLREALAGYATEVKREHGIGFQARVGLHSGDVVVGKIGDDLRMDYTAQGHTVGLAQRMESLAEPNTCYLSDATAQLASGYFALDDLGDFRIKGAVEPVHVHRLVGVGTSRTRFDVSRMRGLSRFVGRAADVRTLEDALVQTAAGNGQVVGVVAEAGTGKSRLCFEFLESCRARGMRVFEGHAVAHGRNIPFLPVLEIFRAYFSITPQDDDRAAREKIAGRMVVLDQSLADALPSVFDFLSVPDPQRPAPQISAEARQRQLVGLMRQVVQSESTATQPTVTLIEDLHWLDAASAEFLEHLVDARAGSRSLLLLNFRPEYHADWMQKSWYRQIPLTPLGVDDIAELLGDLLGADASLAHLAAPLHARTAGNPFFTEEVVQSLIESGHLEGARGAYRLTTAVDRLEVPATVQAVLAARIDRLAEREKRLLQVASVIGKEFPEPLLAAVAELTTDDLKESLAALRRGEFVHERAIYPLVEYAFKHPLTQEVALGSLLRERRRPLHAAVAGAIEAGGGNLEERAALLAHHWDEAGQTLPAALWHRRAAEWIGGSNSAEATRHWQRVRVLADHISEPELAIELGNRSCQMLVELGWRLGVTEPEAEDLLSDGETWARKRNDPSALAKLYSGASMLVAIPLGQMKRAQKFAREALQLAQVAGDEPLIFMNELRVCLANLWAGDLRTARTAIEAATAREPAVMDAASPMLAYDAFAYAPGLRGLIAHEEGRLEESIRWLEQGIARARARDATEVLDWLLGNGSESWLDLGDFARATSMAREAMEIAEGIGDVTTRCLAECALCRVSVCEGNLETAIPLAERWIETASIGAKFQLPWALSTLAVLRSGCGEPDEARRLAHEALALAESGDLGTGKLWSELALARICLDAEDAAARDEAAGWLTSAEQSLNTTGAFSRLPDLLELRAELAQQRADAPGREAALSEALRIHRQNGAVAHAERIARELASR